MRFTHLDLHTHDVAAQHAFYADVLGLPTTMTASGAVRVTVGHTLLTWRASASALAGPYHIAFRVPGQQFDAALAWLVAHTPLLSSADGQTVFTSDAWDARSAYFADGAGNIAEIIAHHRLPATPVMPFGPAGLLGVCELGWATDDVPQLVASLAVAWGVAPHARSASAEFTAVGDGEGLMIVVAAGRVWLPTGAPAVVLPFEASVETPKGRQVLSVTG